MVVQHANDVPARHRPAVAERADALYGAFTPELLIGIGTVAGLAAILGAAVAFRHAGAPVGVCMLLGLSAIMVLHAPPTGPFGLLAGRGLVPAVTAPPAAAST